jgi:hypothetical protein
MIQRLRNQNSLIISSIQVWDDSHDTKTVYATLLIFHKNHRGDIQVVIGELIQRWILRPEEFADDVDAKIQSLFFDELRNNYSRRAFNYFWTNRSWTKNHINNGVRRCDVKPLSNHRSPPEVLLPQCDCWRQPIAERAPSPLPASSVSPSYPVAFVLNQSSEIQIRS